MYFSALKTAIQNLEEKRFYDVALMYLAQQGYTELRIGDGPGDGGRDVDCCLRPDLRIQLSVRKDWEIKVNEEAKNTKEAKKHNFIFITNRQVGHNEYQEFLANTYKQKGEVELQFVDLRKIATALARPGVIRRSYEMLGMSVPLDLHASPKDIAISTTLLFSQEARELRDEIIEANVRAQLYRSPGISEAELVQKVVANMPGLNIERGARSALSRLRTAGRITKNEAGVSLSDAESEIMFAAETEFLTARQTDISALEELTGLSIEEANKLLDLALELVVRQREFDGDGPLETSLLDFLSNHSLTRKKGEIYRVLAASSSARLKQHGKTIDEIFSTNSFDIYRALGLRTDLSLVLDTSVVMPLLFGLTFGEVRSSSSISAFALKKACVAHNIKMTLPRVYLNEMAAHGLRALEQIDVLDALSPETRSLFRASKNVFISYYSHFEQIPKEKEDQLSLKEFLRSFGISQDKSLNSVENRLQTLLEQQAITISPTNLYSKDIRARISAERPDEFDVLIDHDAIVVTMLKENDEKGFVLATWDNLMIRLVEELARVYADTPTRVIDFLSMATGQDFECEQSYSLMATLLHIDERLAAPLTLKLEKIRSVEQAYRLDRFIRDARETKGQAWSLQPNDVLQFIDPPTEQ